MTRWTPVPTPHAPAVGPDDERRLRLALLDVVYAQAWIGAAASPLAAAVLCVALWSAADRSRLALWLGAVVLAMLLRYCAILAFRRVKAQWSARAWEWLFAASLTWASLTWGLGSIYILPDGSPFHDAVVFSFLAGMGGGSALIYSAHQVGALAALYGIVVPMIFVLLSRSDIGLRAMAVGGMMLIFLGTTAILRLGGFIRRSFELSLELEKARRAAEIRAQTDDLTGLYNRGAFYEMGEYLLAQAIRRDDPLALLVVDLDDLKRVNDHHGHAAGDAVLRQLASLAGSCFREVDVVGRLGGDEFGVLLPAASADDAVRSAERLRDRLREAAPPADGLGGPVTFSAGVAAYRPGESLDELIARADVALYESKQRGRDRVTSPIAEARSPR